MSYRVLVRIVKEGTITLDEPMNPHEAVHMADKMLAGPEPEELLDAEPVVVEARGIMATPVRELAGMD